MGILYTKMFAPKEIQVSLMGLDDAGKTTLLFKLKPNDIQTIIPCIGFNVEQVAIPQGNNIKLNVMSWTFGGRCNMRPLWRHYFQYTDGLIFMIDSADKERLDYFKDQLDRVLEMDVLDGKPILFVANKQDLLTAFSTAEIAEKLGLHSIRNRQWYICGTVATKGDGIYEGLDWLSTTIQKQKAGIANIEPETKETKYAKPTGLDHLKNSVASLKNKFYGKGGA